MVTRKAVGGQTSLNGHINVKISVTQVNAPQKVTSAQKDFNNQVDRMPH